MITLEGAIRDFFFFFLQSHCAANCLRTLKWPGRNGVKRIGRSSRAVCRVPRGWDSLAIEFDRVEIAFVSALSYWLKSLTDERGEQTGVPEENP